jgi:hypothetical protein
VLAPVNRLLDFLSSYVLKCTLTIRASLIIRQFVASRLINYGQGLGRLLLVASPENASPLGGGPWESLRVFVLPIRSPSSTVALSSGLSQQQQQRYKTRQSASRLLSRVRLWLSTLVTVHQCADLSPLLPSSPAPAFPRAPSSRAQHPPVPSPLPHHAAPPPLPRESVSEIHHPRRCPRALLHHSSRSLYCPSPTNAALFLALRCRAYRSPAVSDPTLDRVRDRDHTVTTASTSVDTTIPSLLMSALAWRSPRKKTSATPT